jgi:glucose/arabinose dehydrogenase
MGFRADLWFSGILILCLNLPSVHAQPNGPAANDSATVTVAEADYYELVPLSMPQDLVLEVGGMTLLPDGRLAVATRRGDIWAIENPYATGGSRPHYKRIAEGLHEPLGLVYTDGVFYAHQRGELTRLIDLDGDERSDRYEAVTTWELAGNYHEYSYGPLVLPNGDLFVTLNLAWIGHGASLTRWSGWALRVTPEGVVEPFAAGMRSPAGLGTNAEGDLFYAENQGGWVGAGRISHVEKGDFLGNPEGLRWADDPKSPIDLAPDDIPDTGRPMYEVAEQVPELKQPALWLPHGIMGISTSDILVDSTGGAFGPFEDQLFIGDQGQSKIMRAYLETVDGQYQGAVFPFREGLRSGVVRLSWGKDGSLFAGMTSRGWPAIGGEPYGIDRLIWTGQMPLEILEMRARPDGFELEFTRPVDRAVAQNLDNYSITGFTYKYHSEYGSPTIGQQEVPVRAAEVSPDGHTVRLRIDGLREGYIHELTIDDLISEEGVPLLHPTAYYTLNNLPG